MGTFAGFTCEKCKREFRSTDSDYAPVTIQLSVCFGKTVPGPYSNIKKYALWCQDCLMATRFYVPITEDKKTPPVAIAELSFEEKFLMMIEELGFVREE